MSDMERNPPAGSIPDDDGLLSQAALLAGATVAVIRHSGEHGTQQEFVALITGLEAAQTKYPHNELLQRTLNAQVRERADDYARTYATPPSQRDAQDFKMSALNRAAQAADWLEENAPADVAAEWKHAVLAMCRTVAEAGKESGVLGIGGDSVDDFEAGVLGELRRALRYDAPSRGLPS